MPRTLDIVEIETARNKGREKILSLVAAWPSDIGPHEKQQKLKQIYGDMKKPLRHLLENFEPHNMRERRCDKGELKMLMLASFKAIESVNTIAQLMRDNIVDNDTQRDQKTIEIFSRIRARQLCNAFYTYSTNARDDQGDKRRIIKYEAALADHGMFPRDLLANFSVPKLQTV
jgi:hypothetical protein